MATPAPAPTPVRSVSVRAPILSSAPLSTSAICGCLRHRNRRLFQPAEGGQHELQRRQAVHPERHLSARRLRGIPVVCAALDQCHVAGTCAPATGLCSTRPGPTAAVATTATPARARRVQRWHLSRRSTHLRRWRHPGELRRGLRRRQSRQRRRLRCQLHADGVRQWRRDRARGLRRRRPRGRRWVLLDVRSGVGLGCTGSRPSVTRSAATASRRPARRATTATWWRAMGARRPVPSSSARRAGRGLPAAGRGGQASVGLKDKLGTAKDTLTWKWTHGAATTHADLGNPRFNTDYAICLYDEKAGTPSLKLSVTAPHAGFCGSRPCWKDSSNRLRLLEFHLVPDGKLKILLKEARSPAPRRSSSRARNEPQNAHPATRSGRRVRVQVKNSNGVCWRRTTAPTAATCRTSSTRVRLSR